MQSWQVRELQSKMGLSDKQMAQLFDIESTTYEKYKKQAPPHVEKKVMEYLELIAILEQDAHERWTKPNFTIMCY